MSTHYEEVKAIILHKDGTASTYSASATTNLQPLINIAKRRSNPIDSVWLQYKPGQPMEEVTSQYDINPI